MFTQLKDYILWYDGEISVPPEEIVTYLTKVKDTSTVHTTEITKDVEKYNSFVSSDERITTKTDVNLKELVWNIPEEYKNIDILDVLLERLNEEVEANSFTSQERNIRMQRIIKELEIFNKNDLLDVLNAIFFVINTFERQNVVWGVGRGSSVSSYVLYLLKVHDIDSIKYDLHIEDFIS